MLYWVKINTKELPKDIEQNLKAKGKTNKISFLKT